MFGDAMEACGLDRTYGAYVDEATALTLAVEQRDVVVRRCTGGCAAQRSGTWPRSRRPARCRARKIAGGAERLGLPAAVAAYYSEHVEADSVHEQVAARDICGGFVADQPGLRGDVFFGAAACLHLDGLAAREMLDHWERFLVSQAQPEVSVRICPGGPLLVRGATEVLGPTAPHIR